MIYGPITWHVRRPSALYDRKIISISGISVSLINRPAESRIESKIRQIELAPLMFF